jgi:hypothetical protein
MSKSILTSKGIAWKKEILEEYQKYNPKEYKVALAIMQKYSDELGDDEFSYWPMDPKDTDSIKVVDAVNPTKEHISISNRCSVFNIEVDGSIKILGITYEVKNVVIDSIINRI